MDNTEKSWKTEDEFLFDFNLLWTSQNFWERTPENCKPRDEAIKNLFLKYKNIYENNFKTLLEKYRDILKIHGQLAKTIMKYAKNVASERKIEESLEGDPKYEKIIRLIYISGMTNILKNISQQKTTTKIKEDLQLTMEEFYSLLESGLLNINNKY